MLHVETALQIVVIYLLDDVVSILPLALLIFLANIGLDQMLLLMALFTTAATKALLILQLLLQKALVLNSLCQDAHGFSLGAICHRRNDRFRVLGLVFKRLLLVLPEQ